MTDLVMHMCDCEFCESCGVENPTRPALRDAVVEAARAWWDDDDRHPKYAQKLGLALEALERAEGE
jgi:hypothetical protein